MEVWNESLQQFKKRETIVQKNFLSSQFFFTPCVYIFKVDIDSDLFNLSNSGDYLNHQQN